MKAEALCLSLSRLKWSPRLDGAQCVIESEQREPAFPWRQQHRPGFPSEKPRGERDAIRHRRFLIERFYATLTYTHTHDVANKVRLNYPSSIDN